MDYPVVITQVKATTRHLAHPRRSGTREGEIGFRVVVRSCTSGCWSKRHFPNRLHAHTISFPPSKPVPPHNADVNHLR